MSNGPLFGMVATMLVLTALVMGIIIGASSVEEARYRQGQIDCLSGEIKYEQVIKRDTTWTKK